MLGLSKEKRRVVDSVRGFETRIAKGGEFKGILRGDDHCDVEGSVIGECDLSGILRIEKSGKWLGNIAADVVIVAGTVDGNITARTKIELGEASKVTGSLQAPAIAVAEGARFDGDISMSQAEVTRFKERREQKDEVEQEN